jgi:uncharacterized protein (DUF1697 family)
MGRSWLALLRGINVGGNNIIPMKSLAATFEKLGFTAVRTYIQSGNVIFQDKAEDARRLEKRIEAALSKAYGYDAKVVLRSGEEMTATSRAMPKSWQKVVPGRRYNVVFLRHEIDSAEVVADLGAKREIEEVVYRPGVLFWSAAMSDDPRTAMGKLSSKPIYQNVTVRNRNTTLKLCELISEL